MKADISAVRWAKGEDIEAVAVATGARIVARFEDLTTEKLGTAESVRVETLGTDNERIMIIKGKKAEKKSAGGYTLPSISTLFIRGGNNMLLEEASRSLHDAMCVTRNLIKKPKVVYGGGAAEISCSIIVSKAADETTGAE